MHPQIYSHYEALAKKYNMDGPYLEVGVDHGPGAILAADYFKDKPDRIAINMVEVKYESGIIFKVCNSNDMKKTFSDEYFRTVLSNAVLEHDRYFWRSLDEMKRVLAPGGILAVGAPGFIPREQTGYTINGLEKWPATITYDIHHRPDYWRFSREAFRAVICEGLDLLELAVIGQIPRIVAVARKPLAGPRKKLWQTLTSR